MLTMACSSAAFCSTAVLREDVSCRLRRGAVLQPCCSGRETFMTAPGSALQSQRVAYRRKHNRLSLTRAPARVRCQSLGGEEGELASDIKEGAKVKVTTDVAVFHVPKQPDYQLKGREGTVLEIVKFFKGKEISANLPYKCQFIDQLEDGKERKVTAHLAANEIELVE